MAARPFGWSRACGTRNGQQKASEETNRMDAEQVATNPDEIVTLVIRHHVRTSGEAEYERHLSEIIAAAATFPGHLGVNIIRPPRSRRAESHYTIVVRFDTHRHLAPIPLIYGD